MSSHAVGWALKYPNLAPRERLVLILLADHYNDDERRAWMRQETLAARTGYTRITVNKALKKLEGEGIITIEHRHYKDGRYASSRYKIHFSKFAGDHEYRVDDIYSDRVDDIYSDRVDGFDSDRVDGFDNKNFLTKNYLTEKEIEIHTANGETSNEPQTVRGGKRRGARFDPQPFIDAWNEHSGELPKVIKLTEKRLKVLERLAAEHETPQHALELWTDAVRAVARDEFWNERRYGFNNLLAGDKVIQRAEAWRSGSVTKAGQRPGRNGHKGESPAERAAGYATSLLEHMRSTGRIR